MEEAISSIKITLTRRRGSNQEEDDQTDRVLRQNSIPMPIGLHMDAQLNSEPTKELEPIS